MIMIRFLLKGLLRDRSRSIFPLLIVTAGVALTVLAQTWINGVVNDLIETNARFKDGHLKVLTRSYAEQKHQNPIDLSLTKTNHWLKTLRQDYPSVNWQPRIHFGGLLDFPDMQGETLVQGPVIGMAVNLFEKTSQESKYLNLEKALVSGILPQTPGEILVSHAFFEKLNLPLGHRASLISSGIDGGMVVYNFKVTGTIDFGVAGLDRGAMVADIKDVQEALNMLDMAAEIFGYFQAGFYMDADAMTIASRFNQKYAKTDKPFSPVMHTFRNSEIGGKLDFFKGYLSFMITLFIFIMSIVLWNTGIMNGIRRYGELGLRMAMGESKGHIYLTFIGEAFMIGVIGSMLGTALGICPAYYLQEVGFDISKMMGSGTKILMNSVMRAHITTTTFWIGLIPGVGATFIGALISGLAIFKRQTAELFKELEI
jgi:putative ABC transport system permease protein